METLWAGRPSHRKALVTTIVWLVVVVAVAALLSLPLEALGAPAWPVWFFGFVLYAAASLAYLHWLLGYRYLVTRGSVVVEHRWLLGESRWELPLQALASLAVVQGPIDKLLGTGSLVFVPRGALPPRAAPTPVFRDIEGVWDAYRAVAEALSRGGEPGEGAGGSFPGGAVQASRESH